MNTRASHGATPSWCGHVESFDGACLWVEQFDATTVPSGVERAPGEVVLLLSEAEAPCSRWPAALIDELRGSVGAVVRFDTRDIGRSDWVAGGYSLEDLARDATAVLDALGIERAHVVGRSMGGAIGLLLALDRRERLDTLTLLSTIARPGDEFDGPEQWLIDLMAERLFGDQPQSLDARIEWVVEQLTWFAGPRFEFDRASAEADARHEAQNWWRGPSGHGSAVVEAENSYVRLGEIATPTLVIHGTADPVHPPDHGQALARAIPNAEFHLIEGLGHELPAAFVPEFGDIFARFVAGSRT